MLTSRQYSNPEYEFDLTLTEELQYQREIAYSEEISPRLKKAMIWAPLLVLSLVVFGLHVIIAIGLAMFTFMIIVLNRHNRECDAITANCPSCDLEMQKEVQANIEYFVCQHCKLYAKGRDESD